MYVRGELGDVLGKVVGDLHWLTFHLKLINISETPIPLIFFHPLFLIFIKTRATKKWDS